MKTGKLNKNIKNMLTRFLLGDLTDKEYSRLINNSVVGAMMFRQWEEDADIKVKVKAPDYKKIFERINAGMTDELKNGESFEFIKLRKKYKNLRKLYLLFLRAAAVLLILLLTVTGLYISDSLKRTTGSELIAPRGQKSKAVMEDGTVIWLNSGSSIRYTSNYNKRNREVELTGEAYFDVAENKKLPFTVKSSGLVIKALGTSFDLMAYPDDEILSVTLVKGKVEVRAPGNKTVNLSPNQKAIYDKVNKKLIVETVDPVFSVSWKDNVLKFDNKPLPDILTHLERWYDVKIYYPENILRDQRFTITIKTESLREVLELIRISTPIKFEIEIDSVYITLMNE